MKLDLVKSQMIYEDLMDSIEPNACYMNSFNVVQNLIIQSRFTQGNIEDYHVAYGFLINGNYYCRHCYIIYQGKTVIDVTAVCNAIAFKKEIPEYEYIAFEKYTFQEYLTQMIQNEDMDLTELLKEKESRVEVGLISNGLESMEKTISKDGYDLETYIQSELSKYRH